MQDLISRQAAIDAIKASTKKYTGFMEIEMYTDDDAVEAIINLPSAQPEIIHCKECKFYTEIRQDLNTGICSLACRHLGGDGFCSEAERRTDG